MYAEIRGLYSLLKPVSALGCTSGCAVQVGFPEVSFERSGGEGGRLPGEHSAVLGELYRHRGRHLRDVHGDERWAGLHGVTGCGADAFLRSDSIPLEIISPRNQCNSNFNCYYPYVLLFCFWKNFFLSWREPKVHLHRVWRVWAERCWTTCDEPLDHTRCYSCEKKFSLVWGKLVQLLFFFVFFKMKACFWKSWGNPKRWSLVEGLGSHRTRKKPIEKYVVLTFVSWLIRDSQCKTNSKNTWDIFMMLTIEKKTKLLNHSVWDRLEIQIYWSIRIIRASDNDDNEEPFT